MVKFVPVDERHRPIRLQRAPQLVPDQHEATTFISAEEEPGIVHPELRPRTSRESLGLVPGRDEVVEESDVLAVGDGEALSGLCLLRDPRSLASHADSYCLLFVEPGIRSIQPRMVAPIDMAMGGLPLQRMTRR